MRRLTLALITITLLFGLMPTPAQALTYPQVILADTPVAYYRLNETSGTTATDLAYGVNGSYINFPTLNQPGAIYDGDVSIACALALINCRFTRNYGAVNHTFGIEVWFKVASASAAVNATRNIIQVISGSENWRAYVGVGSTGLLGLTFQHTSIVIMPTISYDAWHYLYVQFDYSNNYLQVYLDGSLYGSVIDSAYTTGSGVLYIGGGTGNLTVNYDELAIYEHTLTAAQVLWHYRNGSSAVATPSPTPTNTPLITNTPSITPTPTLTFTPTNTPTPTVTPTLTPGWDYMIPLPSGRTAAVRMEATAGDIAVVMFLVFAVVILFLTVYLRRRSNGS